MFDLRKAGVAVVYVSHRLHEVMSIADRISVLRDGELIDTRLRKDITNSQIVTLVVGNPLEQLFPEKGKAVDGGPVLESEGLSGPGFSTSGSPFALARSSASQGSRAKGSASSSGRWRV